jgi:MSHA biogenesis protein MshL
LKNIPNPVCPSFYGKLATLLAFMFLAACTTSTGPERGKVLAEISDAMRVDGKRNTSSNREAAEKALLPPISLDWPKNGNGVVESRFDLAVSNAPAQQVFMALVSGTRYSMLLPPDVTGNITVNLKDVTVKEALEALRDLYGYDFKVQGTRILVQPNSMQSRVFQINYLAGRRQGASDIRVTSSSITSTQSGNTGATVPSGSPVPVGGNTSRSLDAARITTSSDADFWRDISTALNAIIGDKEGRSVIVNPMSGVVLVKALPNEIRSVEAYLRATQLMVERQVMLEAKIIEVSLSDQFQAGINWSAFGSPGALGSGRFAAGISAPNTTLQTVGNGANVNSKVSVTPGAYGNLVTPATDLGRGFFGLAFQSANFSGLLSFLETQGELHVLSSPRIASINNQKAVLKVGSDEFYVTNVTTTVTSSGTGNTTSPSITLQPFFSGISLDVTPQIDENGMITLHIHPSISVVTEKQKQVDLGQLGKFTLPLASSTVNETDSIVRVQDGNIVAIGGLMKQGSTRDNAQLPLLGDLQGIGALFGQRSRGVTKSELVILIRPTVIQSDESWRSGVEEAQERVRSLLP